jgi:hypothetical protein
VSQVPMAVCRALVSNLRASRDEKEDRAILREFEATLNRIDDQQPARTRTWGGSLPLNDDGQIPGQLPLT